MARWRRIAIAGAVFAAALLAPAVSLAANQSFFFIGPTSQQFTVPDGVTRLTIVAVGGQGGAGSPGSTAAPASGAEVIAPVNPATPGDAYAVLVGGNGGGSTIGAPNGSDGGGFNGGGGSDEQGGWGGGGASAVCAPAVIPCTNAGALVVAAGGGGVSGFNAGGVGGQAGGDGNPQVGDSSIARGGRGATQSAGGAGGAAGTAGVGSSAGAPGSSGRGGNGASGPCAGGGGGGGLFGGGGGGTSSNGCGGGGGGSSNGPAGSAFTSGVAPDNVLGGGEVTIFFETATATTTPSTTGLTFGGSLTDTAAIATDGGAGPPMGSVSFFACGPLTSASGCADGGTEFDSGEPLNGIDDSPSVTSKAFTPPAAGTWCIRAEYSGDANYPPAIDGSSGECFTVAKAATSTASLPAPASITLGASGADSVADTAAVNGFVNGTVGGLVSFFVCGPFASPSGCTSTAQPVGTGPVDVTTAPGGTASVTSAAFTPTRAGTWCFFAAYSGDGNYVGSQDGSGRECFTVAQAPTTTLSTPGDATLRLGEGTTDAATVAGNADGGSPTGTVSFYLCGPLDSAQGCTSTENQIGSAVTATAGSGDTATATSDSFTPTALGTWCVHAVYSGDSNYTSSDDSSADECVTVTKADTHAASQPSEGSIVLGAGGVTDTLTVPGNATGGSPTGTARFFVCGPLPSPSGCTSTGDPVGSDPVDVTPGTGDTATATSVAFTPTGAGSWCFLAVYSGDSQYNGSQDGSSGECVTVTKATATTVSTPGAANLSVGAGTTDAATVTGNTVGGSPTGTVSFYLCGPLDRALGCTSTENQIGSAVTLTAAGDHTATAISDSFTPTALGTWCVHAVYSGDSNYVLSDDSTAAECVTVSKANTQAASHPSLTSVTLGAGGPGVSDAVAVTGNTTAGRPTGSVDFFICGPLPGASTCDSTNLRVGSAAADLTSGGNDTATATSAAFTPARAGTWCFLAVYSGDSNYNSSRDGSIDECFTVAKAAAAVSSRPQSARSTLAGSDRDLVTVTGVPGTSPTGSVAFSVCGPLTSATGCVSGGRQIGTVPIAAGPGSLATATSAAFTPTAPGTWCFRASYGGNADYTGADDGGARECFTVATPRAPSVTIASPKAGAVYAAGKAVRARYSCADAPGAPGLASCRGPVGNGVRIGTSKPGRHAFTVTATSMDGQRSSATVRYRVALPFNRHSVTHVSGHPDGHVTLRVSVPGPGAVNVLVTNWKDNLAGAARLLQPAPGRFVWARLRVIARHKTTLTLDIAPNRRAALVLTRPRYKIRLRVWVTFTPRHGRQRKLGFYGIPLTRG